MNSEKKTETTPRMIYRQYQEALDEVEGLKEFQEAPLSIEVKKQEEKLSKRKNKISPSEYFSENLEDFNLQVDHSFCDVNWNYFKDVLDFYFPSKNLKKYYCGVLPISSYMGDPKSKFIMGEYSERLIKGIMKLYPDDHTVIYKGVNNLDLVVQDWENKKLAHFIFFNENKDLIYNRYMKNIKNFNVRIKTLVKSIPNITVFATPLGGKAPSYFKRLNNKVELSNLQIDIEELVAFESFKYGRKYEYNLLKESIIQKVKKLNNHFRNLDSNFLVEIPFHEILCKEIKLYETIVPFNDFLNLVKYITFFHQKRREWYEDGNSNKKYLLSHYNDFIYSYQIASYLFTSPAPNLKPAKLQFFNYLVERAEKKKQEDDELKNLSIYDVQLEQSKIIADYPGKKSTLLLWLNEFSSKFNLLTRNQQIKNAKVYYSLKKIAPLKSDRFESLLESIHNGYRKRIEKLKDLSSKKDAPIKFHQLSKKQKEGNN